MAGKTLMLNEKQILRSAMTKSGFSQGKAAESAGITRNAFNCQLARQNSTMTLTSVYALLDAMGFEIVVRDKDGKYGGVEYVIDENRDSIETERYVSDEEKSRIEKIKAENAAAMRESMKK